ncbi:Glycolipid transfer protein 1 [Trifolium repens]|nr:Glycolipid transfer protein 1 [Trifolium repens]
MRHRAMDFLVALFRNLIEHPGWAMSQACTDSYNKTLKKWHGWLASSSFTVAMKLAPDTKKFMEVIQGVCSHQVLPNHMQDLELNNLL